MVFSSLNMLFVYVWCDNLLGIINYIDQYIEHNNIERVQWAQVNNREMSILRSKKI